MAEESQENARDGPNLEAAVGFEPTKYGGFANRCLEPLGYAAVEPTDSSPCAARFQAPRNYLRTTALGCHPQAMSLGGAMTRGYGTPKLRLGVAPFVLR